MNQIQELREKRAKAWDAAKAFLDTKRGADGLLAAEDVATYEKMEADVVNLGFVVNVIEDPAERVDAMHKAFSLARRVIAIGVMLYGS